MNFLGPKTKIILGAYIYFFLVAFVCYAFKVHFTISTGLFMLLPAFVLMRLKPGIWKEVFLFSFSLGIPVGFYTQIIAERNFVWKYKPFLEFFQIKDIPLEALFWYPTWFSLVISTYLYFFHDKLFSHKHNFVFKDLWSKHVKYFLFCSFIFLISCLLLNLNAYYTVFPYAYLSMISPVVLLSLFIFLFQKHNHLIKIFLPTVALLFLPMFLYDLIGVYSGQWTFPGEYIYVMDFGIAKLPFEEFFLWLWIWPASVIAYFEEFEGK